MAPINAAINVTPPAITGIVLSPVGTTVGAGVVDRGTVVTLGCSYC